MPKRKLVVHIIIVLVVLCSICFGTEPSDPNRYLNAVREFADNVLKYGWDTYGPKQTPLFVDGLNLHAFQTCTEWGSN